MKKTYKKQIGIGAGLSLGFICAIMIVFSIAPNVNPDNEFERIEEAEWHTIYVWTPTGENDPGHETGGFMSIFLLDYAEDPESALGDGQNATDWNTTGGNVSGYADYDGFSEDAVSEDPFYVVVRCCFTQAQAASGGDFNGSRCRVTLTTSGDETISQTIVGNHTAETYGGGIESENTTDEPKMYINFYFDDNDDGYRITDDGSLTIDSIVIDAKY